ncbi:MAG: acetylglutamate kinase [Trueperaceae bacterium]|nr:MAG: acetylglutamate kinase [Trueperaceae bacterium]
MALVVKFGGNAMTDPSTGAAVAAQLRQLAKQGLDPIVVHGGGPFIAQALDEAGLEHRFLRGLRVTTEESLPVIERVLTMLGKTLAQEIGSAIALTGRDANLLTAVQFDPALGRVGRMVGVNTAAVRALLAAGFTPVIGCLAQDRDAQGAVLNVNADEVAGAVAGGLNVPLIFLTNVPGVLDDPIDPDSVLAEISRTEIEARIEDGRIAGGMIPKVEAGLHALDQGVPYTVIADGRQPNILQQVVSGRAGTRVFTDTEAEAG